AIGRRGYLLCVYCSVMHVGSACCLPGANSVLCLCRHWCHYTVTRTVSCQVQNGSETVIQRVYQSCPGMGCPGNYRTLIRPTYKMSYRTVTTLEWRCCPGFTGSNCEEGELSKGLYPLISRSGVNTSAVHSTSNCPKASVLNLEDLLAPHVNS
uniref:Collagen type XXVI alpha 1 chain n=1 Tax=Amazona collaria TaxID=241587 RepID=A0A8B9GMY9_9PSIT